jgi:tetratricopeptide (TPR) repeat protein
VSRAVSCFCLALALTSCASDRGASTQATDERARELERPHSAPTTPTTATPPRTSQPAENSTSTPPQPNAIESPSSASDPTAQPATGNVAAPASESSLRESETARANEPLRGGDQAREELKRRAVEHIERDELVLARGVLDELLTAPAIAQAKALLDTERPEEALAAIEAVLDDAPGEPRALLLHAEASLRSGVKTRSTERLERALESYLRAGESAPARLGASRAARLLGRTSEAAALAREGWSALGPDAALARGPWSESPERTVAEALWLSFEALDKPAAPALDAEYSKLANEVSNACERLALREPDDATNWIRLAHIERMLGRADGEVRTLERALALAPSSERIAERLASAAHSRGGANDLVATVERARTRHPLNAALWRASAQARLEAALETRELESVPALRLAESEFERWGSLAAANKDASLRERAHCRGTAGWIHLRADRLDAAVADFRSVGALAPGALHWPLVGGQGSALDGLAQSAARWRDRGELVDAARLWYDLHKQSPEVVEWAKLAGQTWRAAGEKALLLSKELKLASDGRISDPQTLEELRKRAGIGAKPGSGLGWNLALKRASTEAGERAGRWFKSSYVSFVDAAQLAPNDVRLLCDAAEVAVYQLKRDLPVVREFLREAIRLGEFRSRDTTLSLEERRALLEAWGDAHECMGVLLLEHEREPVKAKEHFRLSVQIGPDPRPIVVETYLPQCDEAILRKLLR